MKFPGHPSLFMDNLKQQFGEMYDAYAEAIHRHCFFRVYSKEKAEELTQETFLRAWEYMAGGKKIENNRAFLYRIAQNLIIDHSRRKKESSLDEMLETSENNWEPSSDAHKDIEQLAMFKEVVRKMEELSSDEREILMMRYVDDLEPKEIAEILNITANNASVRLNRALKELKKRIT